MLTSAIKFVTSRMAKTRRLEFYYGVEFYYNGNANAPTAIKHGVDKYLKSRRRAALEAASFRPIDLDGELDTKYSLNITLVVARISEKPIARMFRPMSRSVTLSNDCNNFRDLLNSTVPLDRPSIRELMTAAFEDFLTPEEIEICCDVYNTEIIGSPKRTINKL